MVNLPLNNSKQIHCWKLLAHYSFIKYSHYQSRIISILAEIRIELIKPKARLELILVTS